MTITLGLLLLLLAALGIAGLAWHKLGDPVEEHELIKLYTEEEMHEERVGELWKAYKIAKEELGEEPTVDQIFLTRDQLRTQDKIYTSPGDYARQRNWPKEGNL